MMRAPRLVSRFSTTLKVFGDSSRTTVSVPTPFAARQLVSHGHVKVNGKRVTIASYLVKEGDSIELTPKARDMALVIEASKSAERDVPDYVNADHNKMSAKFVRTPKLGDMPYAAQMQPSLVVEFYSR